MTACIRQTNSCVASVCGQGRLACHLSSFFASYDSHCAVRLVANVKRTGDEEPEIPTYYGHTDYDKRQLSQVRFAVDEEELSSGMLPLKHKRAATC